VLEGADESPLLVRTSIYQQLRAAILSCALRPGTQIQERQLVEQYQVSKSPIRDALLKLEEQNLIEVMPRKGYRVKRISLTDARELYEMRQLLERESILRLVETANDETLSALDAFRTLPSPIELPRWIEYNSAFHRFIAANCGNSRLARAGCEAIEQYERLTYVSVTSSGAFSLADLWPSTAPSSMPSSVATSAKPSRSPGIISRDRGGASSIPWKTFPLSPDDRRQDSEGSRNPYGRPG